MITSKPLQVIAKENDLLDTDGWKQFKLIERRSLVSSTNPNLDPITMHLSTKLAMKYNKLMTKQYSLMKRMVKPSGKILSTLSSARSMNLKLSFIKDVTLRQPPPPLAVRRSKYITSLMSSTMAVTN
jgi:hypothetical protein